MAYKTTNWGAWGLGVYVSKSPSISDPAAIYRWQIHVTLGLHVWHFHLGKGGQPIGTTPRPTSS